MGLFKRKSAPDPDDALRPGTMVLLTLDGEVHPDYEPVPVWYDHRFLPLGMLRMTHTVRINVNKRGAAGWAVRNSDGNVVYQEKLMVYPGFKFAWITDEDEALERLARAREGGII